MYCNSIKEKEVYCFATTPPQALSDGDFNIDKSQAKLYVPKGCYQVYFLSAWGAIFDNIIEMEE